MIMLENYLIVLDLYNKYFLSEESYKLILFSV